MTQPPRDRQSPARGEPGAPPLMGRRHFMRLTDDLVAEGERIVADPTWNAFRMWLLNSDELLERVWGRMERYHLAWLNVGRGAAPTGSLLDDAGTRGFIAEVAGAKLAVLRTMRASVERQGWRRLREDPDDDPTTPTTHDEEQR